MPRLVTTKNGTVYELPDEATDEDVQAFLARHESIMSSPEEFSSQPQPQPEQYSALDRIKKTAVDSLKLHPLNISYKALDLSKDVASAAGRRYLPSIFGESSAADKYEGEKGFIARQTEGDFERDNFKDLVKQNLSELNAIGIGRQKNRDEELRREIFDDYAALSANKNKTDEEQELFENLTKLIYGANLTPEEQKIAEENYLKNRRRFGAILPGSYTFPQNKIKEFKESMIGGHFTYKGNVIPLIGLDKKRELDNQKIAEAIKFQGQFNKSKTFTNVVANPDATTDEILDNFFQDPIGIMGQTVAASFGPMSISLTAGLGTAALTRSPYAGAAATGVASGWVDTVYSSIEFMRKNGVDVDDEKAIVDFLENEDNRRRLNKYVRTRATFIGGFDAIAFGAASKVIPTERLISNLTARRIVNAAAFQPPIQGFLGGAGEYSAQYFTLQPGETIRKGDVFLEVIGELAFAPVETTLVGLSTAYGSKGEAKRKALEKEIRGAQELRGLINELPEQSAQRQDLQKQINEAYIKIKEQNPDLSNIQAKTLAEIEIAKAQRNIEDYTGLKLSTAVAYDILQDTNFNLAKATYEGKETTNTFTSKEIANGAPDENGDFVIRDFKNNEVARFKDQQYAVDVLTQLQSLSRRYNAIEQAETAAVMGNFDNTDPLVLALADRFFNIYNDVVELSTLQELNIPAETLEEIQTVYPSSTIIPFSILKDKLSKSQFDKVIEAQLNSINPNAEKLKSISEKKLNNLLDSKNIIDNVNSDNFKRFAETVTLEKNVNKMSIAQKRLLYGFIDLLPEANQKINLPDFTQRPYTLNEYSMALEKLEQLNLGDTVSIKMLQDVTTLNKKIAQRLREDFISAGYVTPNFKYKGTGSRKYAYDGTILPSYNVDDATKIDSILESFNEYAKKSNLKNTKIRFEKFRDAVRYRNNQDYKASEGAYDSDINNIIIPLDNAGLNVLRNNPKQFKKDIAGVLGHESYHSLKQFDLFTQQEQDVKESTVKNKVRKNNQTYYQEANNKYRGKRGYQSEADIIEEAFAALVQDHVNKKPVTGRPALIANKTLNFFEALGNAFLDNGFTTAQDIIEKQLSGRIGARPTGEIRTNIFTQRLLGELGSSPIIQNVPVSDEPSLAFSLTEEQIEENLIRNLGETVPATDRRFREWSPKIDRNVSDVIFDFYRRQVNDGKNSKVKLDSIQKSLESISNNKNNKIRETSNLNELKYNDLDFKIKRSSQILFATTQEYLQTNNIAQESKAQFKDYGFQTVPNSNYYVGFAIGETDVTKGMDTLTVYRNINDAKERIESPDRTQRLFQKYIGNNVGPNEQNEYDQYITPVLFKPQAILLNPLLLSSNFIFNQQPNKQLNYDQVSVLENLQKEFAPIKFGEKDLRKRHKTLILQNTNNKNLLVKADEQKRTVSTSFVQDPPELGNLRYSLRETNGRLIDDVKATLEEQSGAPTLEGYFRQLYGTVASIPPPIKEFLKDARGEGSEYVAPLMTLGAKAFVDQRTGNRKNQGFFHYSFGFPNLSVKQAQEIYDGINLVTQESIKLFPDEIVVYRGSRIDDSYQLIPTTTNKFVAESFGKNLERRNERVEELYYKRKQDGTIEPNVTLEEFGRQLLRAEGRPDDIAKYGYNVKKYLLPKEAIAVNMNALYRGESMLGDANNLYADRYNYIREQELLIPTNFLIDDYGDTTGKQVLTTHLQDVNKIQRDRIIIQGDTQTITSGNFNVPQEQIKTLTRQELLDAKADLILLANEPQYQNDNINADDMYALVNHPAMLAMQNEALSIPDVYDNLTEAQKNKRMSEMIPELTDIATEYAKGNLKYDKKAVIMIGPPATGKSTFAENIAAKKGYAIVDADDAKKQMPEYKDGIGANATHKFSKYIAAEIQKQFIEEGANIIIPKVAGKTNNRRQPDISKIKNTIQDLQSRGYKVDIVYPDANINQAIVRAITRFGETGRFVSVDYLVSIDNKVKDSYNALKDYVKRTATPNVGFTYINNTKKLGEEIVEEDTAQLFQDDRIVDRNRSRSRRGSSEEQPELSEQDKENIQTAKEQEQNSIAAGLVPVINTNASPSAVSAAIEAQKEIKNSTSETNADVDSIINDIPNDIKLKYSFNKNNKPLNQNAEELIENLTVRDDTIESKTIGQLVLEGFKPIDATKEFGMKVREQIADRYGRLALTDVKAGKKNKYGDQMLLASMSASAALYFSDRSGDIFMQSFIRGFPRYDKGKGYTYVTDISQIDGKPVLPFADIFAPAYKNPNLLWAFQAVMRVKRETRFNKEGRKVKVTAADRKKAKQILQDYPEVQTMIDEYNRTNEHTVQFLVDTGVLDAKTAKTWLANSDYIPFYRPLEGMEGFKGPKIFQGLSITPFQKAKGSETKDIVDPITGITNNLRAAVNLGMKNIAANRVMRNLIDLEVAKQVKGNVKGPDIITIRVNGKNVNFKVDDPMLYHSISVMSEADYAPMNFLMSIGRGTKRFVSDLITRAPAFWIAQILRDSLSAYTLSGANYIPVISSVAETFRIAKGMITGKLPEEFVKLRNAGIITGYDKGIRDIDSTQSLIDGYYKNAFKSERPTAEKIYKFPIDLVTGLWDILGQGTAITDAATRVAVYKDTLKRTGNEAEAVFQALEVLNFTRRGNNKAFQTYQQMTMFLNPRLQGLDVFYRGLTGRYGIGRGLSQSKRAKGVWLRLATIMALMPSYYFLVRDSEEYEEAPDEIKDNYLIIPGSKKITGGYPLVIPKPFEVGLISMTIPERLTSYFADDVAGEDVATRIGKMTRHTFSLTLPTAVDPLVENFANYDLFTGRQIVPDYLKGTDDAGYRPQTDTLSKVIGDELNISPLYVENIVRGYTGTLGSYLMIATDSVLRQGLTDAERVKFGIDKLPVIGRFLLPKEGSNYENQFYNLKKDVDDTVSTFRKIQDNLDKGDKFAEGLREEYRIEYMKLLKDYQKDLQDVADNLKELRTLEAQIINDTFLSGEAKRKQLDEVAQRKNDILGFVPELRKEYLETIKPEVIQR